MLLGRSGLYFLGQVATFAYLTETMRAAPEFDIAGWPQFSIYNLLVANFWPVYWAAYYFDHAKLDRIYWHIYEIAQMRAGEVSQILQLFWN
jgi:hypothetical protein